MSEENKTNKAADMVALFQKTFDDATQALNELPGDATPEQRTDAEKLVTEAKTALDLALLPKEKVLKVKKLKIKFLISPCGVFKLPYNVGQIVEISESEANAIVEAKYAEFVK